MLKSEAIRILGGTVTSAAEEIGVSHAAVSQWPADTEGRLPPKILDRVQAALFRRLPKRVQAQALKLRT